MADDRYLLALGDCNMPGTIELEPFAYPVLLGRELGVRMVNCGRTMSTIREGWKCVRRNLSPNAARLVLRKLVKKFKKQPAGWASTAGWVT